TVAVATPYFASQLILTSGAPTGIAALDYPADDLCRSTALLLEDRNRGSAARRLRERRRHHRSRRAAVHELRPSEAVSGGRDQGVRRGGRCRDAYADGSTWFPVLAAIRAVPARGDAGS